MQEEKKGKVKKGFLAVRVGLEDEDGGYRRFTIPISYLYHPQFKKLLEKAQEIYGYHTSGPLRLPCSVDDFLHLKWHIEREDGQAHRQQHQRSLPIPSLSTLVDCTVSLNSFNRSPSLKPTGLF